METFLLRVVIFASAAGFLWTTDAKRDFDRYEQESNSEYWYDLGKEDLIEALQRPVIKRRAKNVILFLGDGMGPSTVTAGRIFKGQQQGASGEEGYLSFDRLPNIALLKTYNVDKQVPDSAATATAYLSGVKANYYTLGLTAAVKIGNCSAALDPKNRAHSIIMWAQLQGKETGIVTTTRITHATPGAAYGSTPNREWECDANIKKKNDSSVLMCKDLARQLIEDKPGINLKVILGGGRQPLGAQLPNTSSSTTCKRMDGRNLVNDWLRQRKDRGASHAYATNNQELNNIDVNNTEYIMGLFAESHMDYERSRNKGPDGQPSLQKLTAIAIQRLQRAQEGFVLLIEGGRIDHALHDGKPQLALEELVSFDEAIQTALKIVDLKNTLVVVTADHSHGLTINGYPDRGNDILGTANYLEGVTDGLDYTTLMFTTGPGYNYQWDGNKVTRPNVTNVDTHNKNFTFQAAVPTKVGWSTHSGEDVAVYAAGPWAHLFHRVHEQSYVAHVIGYSAGMGPYSASNADLVPSSSNKNSVPPFSPYITNAATLQVNILSTQIYFVLLLSCLVF